jgi:glycyl-tRNA synthetase beta chain
MPQLLIELLSEEIPARMQAGAARDLERMARDRLSQAELTFESMRAYAGSRRLTLVVEGLPAAQADQVEERKGPRVTAPAAAVEGFLRSAGVAREDLTERDGVYFATLSRVGRGAGDIVAEMLEAIVRGFPWPKSMVWGDGGLRWVRPLQRILCLLDGEVVPLSIDGIVSGDISEGHRFMGARRPFRAGDFDAYVKALAEHYVVLDADTRRRRIVDGARALCAARGLELVEDLGLLEEVAGMVEWPTPLIGDMDPAFLDLPPEVVRTSMRAHQRYFAVRRPGVEGLAPHFVVVANIEAPDGGELIATGAARVLTARLNDARFFYEEDRRIPLSARSEVLKGVTFHAKLGSMYERVRRIEALAGEIAPRLGADPALARHAAGLAKADLATAMVGEFPELQGVMGAYYAAAEGLDGAIVAAIRDHYKPQGPNDGLPIGPVSSTVALADKIDTLVGFFEAGEKPTGSRDPYALRRTALGVIRIILAAGMALPLRPLLAFAGAGVAVSVIGSVAESRLKTLNYRQLVAEFADPAAEFAASDQLESTFRALGDMGADNALAFWRGIHDAAWIEDVLGFILDRMKVLLRDQGVRHDLCDAAFALGDDDLVRTVARVRALETFLAGDDGANLLAGYKRAGNILNAEARKGALPGGEPVVMPGAPAAEIALIDRLARTRPTLDAALAVDDFPAALSSLAALRPPVDAFFDAVLVNSPDAKERDNRLALLERVRETMERVANFSLVVG